MREIKLFALFTAHSDDYCDDILRSLREKTDWIKVSEEEFKFLEKYKLDIAYKLNPDHQGNVHLAILQRIEEPDINAIIADVKEGILKKEAARKKAAEKRKKEVLSAEEKKIAQAKKVLKDAGLL